MLEQETLNISNNKEQFDVEPTKPPILHPTFIPSITFSRTQAKTLCLSQEWKIDRFLDAFYLRRCSQLLKSSYVSFAVPNSPIFQLQYMPGLIGPSIEERGKINQDYSDKSGAISVICADFGNRKRHYTRYRIGFIKYKRMSPEKKKPVPELTQVESLLAGIGISPKKKDVLISDGPFWLVCTDYVFEETESYKAYAFSQSLFHRKNAFDEEGSVTFVLDLELKYIDREAKIDDTKMRIRMGQTEEQ